MDKHGFTKLVQSVWESDKVISKKIPMQEVERMLDLVFVSIGMAASRAQEVKWIPFGVFRPKIERAKRRFSGVSLEFKPNHSINKLVRKGFLQRFRGAFEVEEDGGVKVKVNEDGSSYLVDESGEELLTLGEVSQLSGVSQITGRKYLRRYGDEIPCVLDGKIKRYPRSVAQLFADIKDRNTKVPGVAFVDLPDRDGDTLFSLVETSRLSGVSMHTLYDYLNKHGDRIGGIRIIGGRRFYTQKSIDAFKLIKKENEEKWGSSPSSHNKKKKK